MGLKLYKKKRRFDKTPEPSGSATHNKGALRFVVQKHDASRLHYDFRLEADGVLKSWAVPKGPSLNPSDKRLAMMVEDHPFDYRNFEGVIPAGNYGAGNVIIWDEGTYESVENPNHSNSQILKEIKSGDLKFRLFGKKLKGIFALVKMKHADEENAWLLIKDHDNYSRDIDITEEEKSVKSGLKVEEIDNKERPQVDTKNLLKGAKKGKKPKFIKPMLSTLVDDPFDNRDFIFEIKWDGYRAIADVNKKNVRLYSRNQISFDNKYPEIVEEFKKFEIDAVFDGEVVALDGKGKPIFQNLQNWGKEKEGKLAYYVFDLLLLDGYNLQDLTLEKRKDILKKILPDSDTVMFSDHIQNNGKDFFHLAKGQGLEGIIAKRKDSKYKEGERGNDWLKIKTQMRQEAVICGFTKPRGGRKYFGALVLGVYAKNTLTYIGHTGTGFDEGTLEFLAKKLEKITVDKSPFEITPETNEPATWVKPTLIAEVSFSGWTDGGQMRHPVFEGLREDKAASEVSTEPIFDEKKIIKKSSSTSNVDISNPDKIFWKNEGYTKQDLINYYNEVADFILPYLKDRPESLRRYPNGIDDDSFFQKDITSKLPSFASTVKINSDSAGKKVNYLLCNNRETLLYMANLGCIDINPWNSTTSHLKNPDYIIFDLDPEDIGFEKVVDAAIEIKKVLEELDVESYPKTSGATGIHIYVPTGAKYTYDQVKSFAEIVVNVVNKNNPDFTSVVRSPSKRSGKVYLDFLQNRIGQTLAAPYSVRPKPNAPVSTPLRWNEVNHGLSPSDFTIENIMQRLEKVGDLWKPVLGRGINLKTTLPKLEKLLS